MTNNDKTVNLLHNASYKSRRRINSPVRILKAAACVNRVLFCPMIGPIDSIEFRMTSNTAEHLAQLQYHASQYNYAWVHAVMCLVYYSFYNPSICISNYQSISAHIFTANHITYFPTATLSIDQSNCSPGFFNFQLTNTTT